MIQTRTALIMLFWSVLWWTATLLWFGFCYSNHYSRLFTFPWWRKCKQSQTCGKSEVTKLVLLLIVPVLSSLNRLPKDYTHFIPFFETWSEGYFTQCTHKIWTTVLFLISYPIILFSVSKQRCQIVEAFCVVQHNSNYKGLYFKLFCVIRTTTRAYFSLCCGSVTPALGTLASFCSTWLRLYFHQASAEVPMHSQQL